ncbi:hypothetical protein COP1_009590 [Malus domestica]
MAECIYDLDWPDDMSERLESVEFLCTEPGRRAPEVQDFLETIDLGTKEDPRPIQISGLLEAEDQAKIVSIININEAMPKDEYPMPMVDLSIDAVAKRKFYIS